MIVEAILNLIKGVIVVIVQGIPQTAFSIPSGIFDGLYTLTNGIGYVLPTAKLLPILVISFLCSHFRVFMAVIDRLKSFIPGFGGV